MDDSSEHSGDGHVAPARFALHPNDPNLRHLLEALPEAVYACDAEGRITFYNASAAALWGREPRLNDYGDRFCGSLKLLTAEGVPVSHDACWMALALKNGKDYGEKEIVVERPDGERILVLARVSPIVGDDGVPVGAVNMLVDVTERRRAQSLLEEQLRQLTLVHELSTRVTRATSLEETFETALDAIITAMRVDRAAILLYDDDEVIRFKSWRGLSESYRAAVEGHSPWRPDQIDAEPIAVDDVRDDPSLASFLDVILEEGVRGLAFVPLVYEDRLLGKVMAYANEPHRFAGRDLQLAQTIANHVAFAIGRRQAEQALLTSEQKLRTILDASTAVIFVKDPEGRYIVVNSAWCDLFGWPMEKAIGKTDEDMFPGQIARSLRENDLAVLRDEVPMRFEEHARVAGKDEAVYLSVKFPLRDATGRVYGIGGISTDITRLIRTQEALQESERRYRALNETLEQRVTDRTFDLARANELLARRNQELQDFAHSASHDLQEPLRKFRTFLGMLSNELPAPSAEVVDYIRRMDGSAARMSELIRALLTLSQVSTPADTFERVDLNAVLPVVLSDLEMRMSETGAQVRVDPLVSIEADPLQMHQLFQNLIANALKFVRKGARPEIEIMSSPVTRGDRSGLWTRIIVADNGIGFEERFAERLFRPFQRLHGRGEFAGVGMGLAICRRIVERHGGSIRASGTPGVGSRFEILLPLVRPSSAVSMPEEPEWPLSARPGESLNIPPAASA